MIDRLVPRPDGRRLRPVRRFGRVLPLLLLVVLWPMTARAQDGAITGQVVDASIREPIPSALVELVASGGRVARSTTTDNSGRFQLRGISPGTYSLVISTVGYETRRIEGIRIGASPVVFGAIEMTSRAFELNPVVVTASREREKALEAPAAVFTVPPVEIEEQPATTPVDYVKGMPGVDVVSNGLSQHNVVARGFNNVFSGALFVLTDNRWASVPSLRFNAYNLIPQTNEDIQRIEFVLGPASALYGPNVQNGVMHIITKSPLESQETVVSVTGGERDVFKGAFRHSGLFTENIGYKISGSWFRGNDWRFIDPVEAATDTVASACLAAFDATNPACRAFAPPGELPDREQIQRIGARDFDQERFSGTGRLDFRLADRSTLVLEGGTTRMGSSLEMTGIGTAQADDWTYSYVQARLNHDDLFAQVYLNVSDAGDTFLLRDGAAIVDNSALYVGQVQHASRVGDRQRFIYGADLIRTIPRTDSTITGINESDDDITELGAYVQSETEVSELIKLVAAARVDYHDVVEEAVFSPRAGVVLRPREGQNFRFTWNRAFSQPTTNNLSLDLQASPTLGPFTAFSVRASGSRNGFEFPRTCDPRTLAPFGTATRLCIRSPFNDAESELLPLDVTPFWDDAVTGLETIVEQGLVPALGTSLDPDLRTLLLSLDPSGQVNTTLKELNPTTGSFGPPVPDVADVRPIEPTIQNTLEAGYKGVLGDRLLLNADVYYTRIEDFIGPLLVESPSAFLDPGTLGAFLVDTLAAAGLTETQIRSVIGGLSNVPLGTVTPANPPNPERPSAIFLTYRNFGDVDLWGADVSATYLLTDEVSVSGAYSFVNKNFFENLDDISDVALNSPENKASASVQYRGERNGLSARVRGRYTDSFPVNSGVFVGHVSSYTVFDVNLSYDLPFAPGTNVTLTALNVFDNEHREMVGAPELGRLLLLRLRQSF